MFNCRVLFYLFYFIFPALSLSLSDLYHFSVLEDLALGEPIGRIKANDQDIGENAKSSYDFIDGDGMDIFEITSDAQTQEGIIRLRKVNGNKMKDCLRGPWC